MIIKILNKKRCSIIYFFLSIIFLISFFIFTFCSNNNITLEIKPFEKEFLPVFIVPEIDYKKNNDIIGVSLFFIKNEENEKLIEYTVLFKDEDHPASFINFIYDIYRSFKYKRIIDTESFLIDFIKTADGYWKVNFVNFPDDYSSNQVYFEKNAKHFSLKLEGNIFEKKDNRIIIYINTWNHMFSSIDTNLNLEKKVIESYTTYSGNRKEVEKQFNKKIK